MNDTSKAATYARNKVTFQSAIRQANAEYAAAESIGDQDAMDAAWARMGGLQATWDKMDALAWQDAAQINGPLVGADGNEIPRRDAELCRAFGVSPNELSIAKNWTADSKMSDADKVRGYVENRARYQHMRATGQYRDDQGVVKRS